MYTVFVWKHFVAFAILKHTLLYEYVVAVFCSALRLPKNNHFHDFNNVRKRNSCCVLHFCSVADYFFFCSDICSANNEPEEQSPNLISFILIFGFFSCYISSFVGWLTSQKWRNCEGMMMKVDLNLDILTAWFYCYLLLCLQLIRNKWMNSRSLSGCFF